MSRIGKLPISIPTGVTVTLKDNVVTVKGPKGELSQFVDPSINVAIEDGHVMLTENENEMLDNIKQFFQADAVIFRLKKTDPIRSNLLLVLVMIMIALLFGRENIN